MKIKFYGTRGSYPTSNKENEYYGGSTPCLEITNKEQRLILDAGTGILALNNDPYYNESKHINILLTHLHMDHIQGLGFFKPLFNPNKEVHIWGPAGSTNSLFSRLNRFLSPPLFPLPLRDIPGNLTIHELSNTHFTIGDFEIYSEFVCHPGPTIGYRIKHDDRVLTYIPDHEPVIGRLDLFKEEQWISGFKLAENTDILVHDAQYSSEEYMTKVGWGHSSIHHAAEFAKCTHAKNLVLFHHDPVHTDAIKTSMLENFLSKYQYPFNIEMARQGDEKDL